MSARSFLGRACQLVHCFLFLSGVEAWKRKAPFVEPKPLVDEAYPLYMAFLILGALLASIALLVCRNWESWYGSVVKAAFNAIDADGSGTVDRIELYSGVLQLYMKMNQWGIICRPPSRKIVIQLVEQIDHDDSGELCYDEFRTICKLLSRQSLGRAVTQFVFTLTCPMIAELLVGGFTKSISAVTFPAALANLFLCIRISKWGPKVLAGCIFGPVVLFTTAIGVFGRVKFGLGYTAAPGSRLGGFLPAMIAENWASGLVLLSGIKAVCGSRFPF